MLQTLTAQLLQTNQLQIPYVGLFRIVHHPAVLQFADRLLHPPFLEIIFELALNNADSNYPEAILSEKNITEFGQNLKTTLATAPFQWSGVGTLSLQNNKVVFQPEERTALLPVTAQKILRENRSHAILVGDRQQSSADTSFINEGMEKKKTWLWIGWILLLISLLVAGWMIYKNGASFGSKIKTGTALHHTNQQNFYL